MVTSSPASQRQSTQRASDASTSGRTPAGRRMETEPESVRALIGPPPVEDSVTLPLTVLNLDGAGHEAEPDLARHRGDLGGARRTDDDGARLGRRPAPTGAVVDLDLPRARPQIHLGRLSDADPPAGRDDAHRTERSLQLDRTRPRPHHDVGPRRTPHVDRLRGMDRLDVDDPIIVVDDLRTPGHDHVGVPSPASTSTRPAMLLMRSRTRASDGLRATPPLSHHDPRLRRGGSCIELW